MVQEHLEISEFRLSQVASTVSVKTAQQKKLEEILLKNKNSSICNYFVPRAALAQREEADEEDFSSIVQPIDLGLNTQFQYDTANDSNGSQRRNHAADYTIDGARREIGSSSDWGSPNISGRTRSNEDWNGDSHKFYDSIANNECHLNKNRVRIEEWHDNRDLQVDGQNNCRDDQGSKISDRNSHDFDYTNNTGNEDYDWCSVPDQPHVPSVDLPWGGTIPTIHHSLPFTLGALSSSSNSLSLSSITPSVHSYRTARGSQGVVRIDDYSAVHIKPQSDTPGITSLDWMNTERNNEIRAKHRGERDGIIVGASAPYMNEWGISGHSMEQARCAVTAIDNEIPFFSRSESCGVRLGDLHDLGPDEISISNVLSHPPFEDPPAAIYRAYAVGTDRQPRFKLPASQLSDSLLKVQPCLETDLSVFEEIPNTQYHLEQVGNDLTHIGQCDPRLNPMQATTDGDLPSIEILRRKFFCSEYRDMVELFALKRKDRERRRTAIICETTAGRKRMSQSGVYNQGLRGTCIAVRDPHLNVVDNEREGDGFFTEPPAWYPPTPYQKKDSLSLPRSLSLSRGSDYDQGEERILPPAGHIERSHEEWKEEGEILSCDEIAIQRLRGHNGNEDGFNVSINTDRQEEERPQGEGEGNVQQEPVVVTSGVHRVEDSGNKGEEYFEGNDTCRQGFCLPLRVPSEEGHIYKEISSQIIIISDSCKPVASAKAEPNVPGEVPISSFTCFSSRSSAHEEAFSSTSTAQLLSKTYEQPILVPGGYSAAVARACFSYPISFFSTVSSAMFGAAVVPDTVALSPRPAVNSPYVAATVAASSSLKAVDHAADSNDKSTPISPPDGLPSPSPSSSTTCTPSPNTLLGIKVLREKINSAPSPSFPSTFLLPGALDSDDESDTDMDAKSDSELMNDDSVNHVFYDATDDYNGVANEIIEPKPTSLVETCGGCVLEVETSIVPRESAVIPIAPHRDPFRTAPNIDSVLTLARKHALNKSSASDILDVEGESKSVAADPVLHFSSSPAPQLMINGRLIKLGQNPFSLQGPCPSSSSSSSSPPGNACHDTPFQHDSVESGWSTKSLVSRASKSEDKQVSQLGYNQFEEKHGNNKTAHGLCDNFDRFEYRSNSSEGLNSHIEPHGEDAPRLQRDDFLSLPPSPSDLKSEERIQGGRRPSCLLLSSSHPSSSLIVLGRESVRPPSGRPVFSHRGQRGDEVSGDEEDAHDADRLDCKNEIRSDSLYVSRVDDRCKESNRKYEDDDGDEDEDEGDEDCGDDLPCAVCLERDPWEGDPMVFCEGACGMCVHIKCYGLDNTPQGDFLCESCLESKRLRTAKAIGLRAGTSSKGRDKVGKKPRCVLCRTSSGMMKRSVCGQWCHPLCVLFTAELTLDDSMRANNLGKLDPDRASLQCRKCRDYGGACVQCCHEDCLVAFHPYCAFTSDHSMVTRIDSQDFAHYEIYCRKHDPSSQRVSGDGGDERGATTSDDVVVKGGESKGLIVTNPNRYALNLSSPCTLRHDSPLNGLEDTAVKDHGRRGSILPQRRRLRRHKQLDLKLKYEAGTSYSRRIPPDSQRKTSHMGHSGDPSNGSLVDSPDINQSSRSEQKAERKRRSKESRKRLKTSVGRFFEVEAVISGSDSGDGGEDGSESDPESDQLSGDFINDGTYTQDSDMGCETQQHMYHAVNNALDADSPGLCRFGFRGAQDGLPNIKRLLDLENKKEADYEVERRRERGRGTSSSAGIADIEEKESVLDDSWHRRIGLDANKPKLNLGRHTLFVVDHNDAMSNEGRSGTTPRVTDLPTVLIDDNCVITKKQKLSSDGGISLHDKSVGIGIAQSHSLLGLHRLNSASSALVATALRVVSEEKVSPSLKRPPPQAARKVPVNAASSLPSKLISKGRSLTPNVKTSIVSSGKGTGVCMRASLSTGGPGLVPRLHIKGSSAVTIASTSIIGSVAVKRPVGSTVVPFCPLLSSPVVPITSTVVNIVAACNPVQVLANDASASTLSSSFIQFDSDGDEDW